MRQHGKTSEQSGTTRGSRRMAKGRRGRCTPPNDSLIGREEVAEMLGYDRRSIRRTFQDEGMLTPALVEADGTEWFDRKAVEFLAKAIRIGRRQRPKPVARKKLPAPNVVAAPTAPTAYEPPIRSRPDPLLDPEQPQKQRDNELRPIARTRPSIEIRDEWWDLPEDGAPRRSA